MSFQDTKSPDWITLSTIGSVTGLSGSIWLVTNFTYSLINYFYKFFTDLQGIDKTFYCLSFSLILGIILIPKVITKFFPPIKDKTVKVFIISLNIILVLSSANGLQTGYSSVYSGLDPSIQESAIILFDGDPWLKPKSMINTIHLLRENKSVLEKKINQSSLKIDSLNNKIEIISEVNLAETLGDTEESTNNFDERLKLTNQLYSKLLLEKSDSIRLVTESYNSLRAEYQKLRRYNRDYDKLLKTLETEIEKERLNSKKLNSARRKIDSLDQANEH